MKIKSAVFNTSAESLKTCPRAVLPEFAMIGRSNVGKSSLINMLTDKKGLARTSATPGKTRLMNFFTINDEWSLVDLPGYGFAKIGKDQRADFNEAVADYMEKREGLYCVFVLIDSRLPPQAIDLDFLRWMERFDVPYALVFTKADKQSASVAKANVEVFKKTVSTWRTELPPMFLTSATTKLGRSELLRYVDDLLAEE